MTKNVIYMTTYMAGKIDISLIFQALWQNEQWNIRFNPFYIHGFVISPAPGGLLALFCMVSGGSHETFL